MLAFKICVVAIFCRISYQLNNGLGLQPQMGMQNPLILYNFSLIFCQKVGTVGITLDVISMKI